MAFDGEETRTITALYTTLWEAVREASVMDFDGEETRTTAPRPSGRESSGMT